MTRFTSGEFNDACDGSCDFGWRVGSARIELFSFVNGVIKLKLKLVFSTGGHKVSCRHSARTSTGN